jgi:hypothetical protein
MPDTAKKPVGIPRAIQGAIFLGRVLHHAMFGIAPRLSVQRGVITRTCRFLGEYIHECDENLSSENSTNQRLDFVPQLKIENTELMDAKDNTHSHPWRSQPNFVLLPPQMCSRWLIQTETFCEAAYGRHCSIILMRPSVRRPSVKTSNKLSDLHLDSCFVEQSCTR